MERNSTTNSRPNKKPTPAQINRRRAVAVFLGTAIVLGASDKISKSFDHSSGAAKAKTELVANPSEQRVITIGPAGLFPNLPAAVTKIASQNSELSREDIRQMLSDELNGQLSEDGIPKYQYDTFHPAEELTLPVPEEWGVGEPVQLDGGTQEASSP